MLPLSDSLGWMACLLPLFSLNAFCTLIFAEVAFYLGPPPPPPGRGQKEIFLFSPSPPTRSFPQRKGNPLQDEKETLCRLRMGGG